jgi:hypothetical protein
MCNPWDVGVAIYAMIIAQVLLVLAVCFGGCVMTQVCSALAGTCRALLLPQSPLPPTSLQRIFDNHILVILNLTLSPRLASLRRLKKKKRIARSGDARARRMSMSKQSAFPRFTFSYAVSH